MRKNPLPTSPNGRKAAPLTSSACNVCVKASVRIVKWMRAVRTQTAPTTVGGERAAGDARGEIELERRHIAEREQERARVGAQPEVGGVAEREQPGVPLA
jgi:transposase